MKGLIFDLKEFAVHDGEGIRTTVFMKGCPLRCIWCHNPEGLDAKKELYVKQKGCLNCGLCRKLCEHPECQPFGRCLHICPQNLLSVAGVEWESRVLAEKLLRHADFFRETGGGVTLSGGEPLLQAEFCAELLGYLREQNIHCTIETSGYVTREVFDRVTALCDFVIMDLKIADSEQHQRYTGVRNESILANAKALQASGKPHLFRTPLIPGITDTEENLTAISVIAGESPVERLPYNHLAPVKYPCVGREFPELLMSKKG